ncbi:MAG: D-alanyl-D-alanine carboxypeptidase/D-alanyl-D-alanine-endopeptidase, partial [Rhodospirillaceae bacterium]|nr:D-alanyl-D-alanine carboxypeptidase/D-alanyl-D-alanine-endopeptidase [Rhodospirillaceae bacterium]
GENEGENEGEMSMRLVFGDWGFESGGFENLLKKPAFAAVTAVEGFLAAAEKILDEAEFLSQAAPVQQLLLRPFGEIGEHDQLLVDQHLDQVLDDPGQGKVRPHPLVVGDDGGDVGMDEGHQGRIVGRHLVGALHRFGIDGQNLSLGVLAHEGHRCGLPNGCGVNDIINRRLKGWLTKIPNFAKHVVVAALVVIPLGGCQGPALPAPGQNITEVRAYEAPPPVGVDALIRKHGLFGARVGYALLDLESGDPLAGRNENALFIPASTAKVPTTVAALGILGADYRFRTRVLVTGKVAQGDNEGVLGGDLYLQGGGDPLLTIQDLMGLARRLKDQGVSGVSGKFFYDQSLLRTFAEIEARQPENARYNPGLSALSLDFNQTLLNWRPTLEPGGEKGVVRAYQTPTLGDARPGLSAADPGRGRNVVPGVAPGDEIRWLLSPSAPVEGAEFLPVKRPGLRTARVFRRLARMLGVTLPEPRAGTAPRNASPMAGIRGLALADVVRLALEHSNNMVTELIGQVAARHLEGEAGDLSRGSELLGGWLRKRLPDTDWDGFRLTNHSGLSSKARVNPKQMAAIVRFAVHRRHGGGDYLSLLPASGLRDSMRRRFRDPATALRIWAKTGTLKYAKGLVGVFFAASGRPVAFALFVTDFDLRRAYDAAANVQSPEIAAPAEDWIRRAEAFEQDLLREWILGI